MAASKRTPGMTRKNFSAGCTGWTWGTVITSAMFHRLHFPDIFTMGHV
jgi:hypothetical protein